MPSILGVEYGRAVAALIERANAALAPRSLSFQNFADAPAEARKRDDDPRGLYDRRTATIYLNVARADCNEHTIAHEVGHAIIHARGWVEVGARPDLIDWMSYLKIFSNDLQHIALEQELRESGFDTAPGYQARLTTHLSALRDVVRTTPTCREDPSYVLPAAVRFAEGFHNAKPADFAAFRRELKMIAPDAVRLGIQLARAVHPRSARETA